MDVLGFLCLSLVGVAILSSPPEKMLSDKREDPKNDTWMPMNNGPRNNPRATSVNTRAKLQKILKKIDNEVQESVIVKLGDASIAAPFTSKMSSIQCSKDRGTSPNRFVIRKHKCLSSCSMSRDQTGTLHSGHHPADVQNTGTECTDTGLQPVSVVSGWNQV